MEYSEENSGSIDQDISLESGVEQPDTRISGAWIFFIYLYLIVDYGRPQDTFPFLGYLRPALIVTLFLTAFLIKNRSNINLKIPQVRLIILFIVFAACSIPFALNGFYAYSTTKGMVLMLPFILSCTICINSTKQLQKLITVLILLMAYQAQYAILHGGIGSGNQFLDENDLALYVNTWLPFSIALFLSVKGVLKKLIFGLCTGLGLGAVVVSASRGGFLGMIGMFLVYWLFSPKKWISLIVVGLIALCLYLFAGNAYWNEMKTSTDTQDGTAQARIESWKSAINMFKGHPFGVGAGNFPVWFSKYQTGYFKREMWGRQAHSLWFTLLPELGIQGVLLYFILLFKNLKQIFTINKNVHFLPVTEQPFFKNISVAFLASLAGYFCSATFLSVLYYAHYWYLAGMIAATAIVFEMNTNPNINKQSV